MKRFLLLLFFAAGLVRLPAQTLLLKSGAVVPADGLVRKEDMLMTSIKTASGGKGQIGFHVTDVAEMNLPEPEDLTAATALVAKGQFAEAFAKIDPLLAYQKTLVDIPGNWWAKTALVEVSALSGLHRDAEAGALMTQIAQNSKDPEVLIAAKLQLALTAKYPDPQQALTALDEVIGKSKDPQTLSRAWIAEGDIHYAQHDFDEALLAYLTVPVFYAENNPLAPKALWGSAQSYARIKDVHNAAKAYHDLIATYPDAPESILAKAELNKEKKP